MSEGVGYLPEHVVDILVEVCLGGGEHGVDVHAAAARQLQQPRTVSFNIINIVPSTPKQVLAEFRYPLPYAHAPGPELFGSMCYLDFVYQLCS